MSNKDTYKYDPTRTVRIPTDVWSKLGQWARNHGTTRSAVIRTLIEDFLARKRRQAASSNEFDWLNDLEQAS